MMTSSNIGIFRFSGLLYGEITGHLWTPPPPPPPPTHTHTHTHTKVSDAELWCLLWSAPEKNGWVNNGDGGVLRRHCAYYDITVMWIVRNIREEGSLEIHTACWSRSDLYKIIAEYFLGLWAEGKTKDYVDRKGNEGTSDRLVPAMPYQYKSTTEGQTQFNLRKMVELPHALTLAGDVDGLKEHIFLNFDYLYYKVKALSSDR